jgi:hypothetical protein
LVANERMMVEERRECNCTALCMACHMGRGWWFLGFERRRRLLFLLLRLAPWF